MLSYGVNPPLPLAEEHIFWDQCFRFCLLSWWLWERPKLLHLYLRYMSIPSLWIEAETNDEYKILIRVPRLKIYILLTIEIKC